MYHSGIQFISEKIQDILKSRKMDLYLIVSWLWSIVVTITIYAFVYFGLFKIDSKAFVLDDEPGFFSFVGFSFGKLMPSTVSTIAPRSLFAVAICYLESITALLILVILFFTILTSARERYKEDVEKIVSELNEIGVLLQQGCQQLFNVALSDVEKLLLNDNRQLVNQMRKLRGLPELPINVTE